LFLDKCSVCHGESSGGFAAVDAKTGKTIWHVDVTGVWKGSPMTYTVKGRQYVAVAAAANVLAFGLHGQ
jgi:alcohol dehydrogenase (cytochrome c)